MLEFCLPSSVRTRAGIIYPWPRQICTWPPLFRQCGHISARRHVTVSDARDAIKRAALLVATGDPGPETQALVAAQWVAEREGR